MAYQLNRHKHLALKHSACRDSVAYSVKSIQCSEAFLLMQVLPQLLHYMDVDAEDPESPDWGCIAVYSCPNSCSKPVGADKSAYMEEFAWVQPP